MLLRILLVGLFAILAATHVIRTAVVAALAEEQASTAAALWPDHPDVIRSVAMGEVGAAAGRGQEPSPATLERLQQLAAADPLAAEPWLVHGAIALRGAHIERAESLLLKARARDPRSEAARFLLADLYLRTGRIRPGLAEMSVLGRLVPGAMEQVAPALAAYATSPDALPHLKGILLAYPELAPALLSRLADDPDNAELIVAIAPAAGRQDPAPPWQERLLNGMVATGEYERAHRVWAMLSGVAERPAGGLFNPTFDDRKTPPPFNWSLVSNASGVAEPDGGGLRVLYFGRDDVALASQLVLLPPGHYRLAMHVSGQPGAGSGIQWRVMCLPASHPVLVVPVGEGAVAQEFSVPEGCAAQRLELRGEAQEFSQSANFRVSGLELTRIGD